MSEKYITLPFTEEIIASLKAGDMLRLSGTVYTARDAAHQRLVLSLQKGEAPPIPLANEVIYYVGPAPSKAGQVIGPAGPTTSGRMDPYTIPLLALGVKGLIGKGYRSLEVKQALMKHQAVYMAAVGGAAALLARHITQSDIVAYDDLETEAIRKLTIEAFPVIVVHDIYGGDAYEMGPSQYGQELGNTE